jgi:hypothetical protein
MDPKTYAKEYYKQHRDEIIAKQLIYHRLHRDKYLAYMREYNRAYYQKHHVPKPKKIKPVKEPKEPKPAKEPKLPKEPKQKRQKKEIPLYVPPETKPTTTYERGNFILSFD